MAQLHNLSMFLLLYLQAGAMLGDAFLHQLPHAFGMNINQDAFGLSMIFSSASRSYVLLPPFSLIVTF